MFDKKTYRVFLWGAGYYLQQVVDEINNERVFIAGIIDNDEKKQQTGGYKYQVFSPDILKNEEFDYIVITIKDYCDVIKECILLGISNSRIIPYWGEDDLPNELLVKRQTRIELLIEEIRQKECMIDSLPFELDSTKRPIILSSEKLLEELANNGKSLCRFGDGEYEIIRGKTRAWFQKTSTDLSLRLLDVLHCHNPQIIIAIAQNYFLADYSEEAAEAIRTYMYGETRKAVAGLLEKDRVYYDAYVSRPYYMYKDKGRAEVIFGLWKSIWSGRNILIVEGEFSKCGISNDLFVSAINIRRIICPYKNSWDKYESIMKAVSKYADEKDLILVSLGPTATVLCYDLALKGYQAIDIGQLDVEYEWYLRKSIGKEVISNKMVAEVLLKGEGVVGEGNDGDSCEYEDQVLEIIK